MRESLHKPSGADPVGSGSGEAAFRVSLSRELCDDEWDRFVSGLPGAQHEQTTSWARVKREDGWQAIRTILRYRGKIVGGAQLLYHRVNLFGRVGYVPHGPCLADSSPDLTGTAIRSLLRMAKTAGVGYLIVDPGHAAHSLPPRLHAAGFRQHPEALPPVRMMSATTLINLTPDNDEILARMRRSTRYNVRLGLRRGVRVREGGASDIDLFHSLMLATSSRRGESPVPASAELFHRIWREYHPRGWVRLSFATYRGEIVCGDIAFPFADVYRTWKFGWSGQYRECKACDVLCWDSITWAKQRGFNQLDLVQVDPEVAAAATSGKPVPPALRTRRLYGPTNHKMGFGGRLVHLPGAYGYVMNPVLRAAYTLIGAPLLRNNGITELLGHVTGRTWQRSVDSP